MPSDQPVMLIKGLSFHVKVRSLGKAREKRNYWKIRDGRTCKQLGGTQSKRIAENTELCWLRGP